MAARPDPSAAAATASAPSFGDAFWKRWGDGKGELAGYDLVFPRYGELRRGIAVTVFVTETFSNSLRVKAAPGKLPQLKTELAQLGAAGLHEEELVAHIECLRLLADLAAEQGHDDTQDRRRAELPGEPGVWRAGYADGEAAGLQHGEGLLRGARRLRPRG